MISTITTTNWLQERRLPISGMSVSLACQFIGQHSDYIQKPFDEEDW